MADDVLTRPLSRPLTKAPPMTDDNAKKMIDVFGGEEQPQVMSRPLVRPIRKPGESAAAEIGRRGSDELNKYGQGVKEAATAPLTEKGNLLKKVGEVGGRVGSVAANAIGAAASPVESVLKTGINRAIPYAAAGAEKLIGDPRFKAANITPEKREALTQDIGDVAENVALTPTALSKTGAMARELMPAKELAPGVNSAEKIDSAAIKANGQVYTGKSHAQIREANPEIKKGEEGFVTNTRQFVGREAAMPIAAQARQILQEPTKEGQLHSEDIGRWAPTAQSKIFSPDAPIASTKSVSSVEGVADKLYQSRQAIRADYKEFSKWGQQFKDVPKEFWQKALDHTDDPKGVPLTPQEKIIYDRSVGVMKDEIDANRKEIKASGFDPKYLEEESGSLGGAIRQRKGMNTPLDRMTGEKSRAPEGGRSLSRSAGTFKGRNMMALEQDGKRTIVHINPDGEVVDAGKKGEVHGQIDPDTGAFTGKGKIVEATRKEIEAATGGAVQYHDNAFGVYGTTLMQSRRAVRSTRILEDIKKSPDFDQVARAPYSKGEVPKGWKEIPDAPEFRGYRFEPRYAEEIEDFIHGIKRDTGALGKLDKINRFTLNLLFWANPIHAYNITDAFLVTKGAGGLLKDLPGTSKDLLASIKSVATRDKYNMQQARAGVPMPGLDTAGEEFRRKTLDIMGVKMRQDPQTMMQFAKAFGFDKPADFLKRVSEVSHKAVFSWQDVLQQTLERGYMRKGLSQAEATEKAAKTFMNYRTPSRVGDQRWIGQALQGQAWLDFPKYSYGRLKGLFNIAKGSAYLDPHSIDQLLTIAILYEFGKSAIDPVIKDITGKDNAEFGSFGYTAPLDAAVKTYEGQRTPQQAIQSLGAPGYAVQALDTIRGVNPFTGKATSVVGETPGEYGMDIASELANKLSPMQRLGQVSSGQIDPSDLWLEQMGVKFPGDYSQSRGARRALRSRERYGTKLEQELGQ